MKNVGLNETLIKRYDMEVSIVVGFNKNPANDLKPSKKFQGVQR